MRYYMLKQDRMLRNLIEIEGFHNCPDIIMDRNAADTFKRCANMYVNGDERSQYPDIFQSPVLMISEKMFQTVKYYDTSVIYKTVVLTDIKMKRQEVYRLMMPEIIDAESPKDKTDSKAVIKNRIFYIKEGIEHYLIVAEDVLESMLSSASVGIIYEEVNLEKWGKYGI